MQFNYAFIRSKVARRVIWLFFISALVPIAATAFYSFIYVTDLLVEQSYKQLQSASKLYGMAVLDRLLIVDSKFRKLSENPEIVLHTTDTGLVEQVKKNRSKRNIDNQIDKLTVEVASTTSMAVTAHASFAENKSTIYSKTGSDGVPRIYLRRDIASSKKNKIVRVVAELNNDFIWGDKDNLPFATFLCVIDATGKVLFCPNSNRDALLQKIRDASERSDPRRLTWVNADGTNLAVAWDLFIKSNFSGADWKIISSRPEADALLPVYAYQKIFPLVILFSFLTVLLLSMIQVRRIMLPLEQLVSATRRLARYEFDKKVEVSSKDEFKELGDSFNTMAGRLEKQFNTLRVLSDIDHLILTYPDLDVVLANIFDMAHKIVSCDFIVITLLESPYANSGWTYIKEVTGNKPPYLEKAEIPIAEISRLQEQEDVELLDLKKESLQHLAPVVKHGVMTAQVGPILIDGSLRAIFSLGYRAETIGAVEDVGLVRDIIDRLAVALATADRDEKLYRQAHFDFLTGLPNRQLFNDRLEQHIIHARRKQERAAVLYIDLDRFKNINDSLGHASGDKLLRKVSERMANCVRETDTVSRLGGDEFVVLLSNVSSPKDAGYITEHIISEISKPYIISGREIFINASVGIVIYPEDGKDTKELLAHADAAMYHAKESGRGRYKFFEESMNTEIVRRIEMETAMRHALERDEFCLYYQPQIDLGSGKVKAIEALIRWNHPELGLVMPGKFVPLAEECGLIEPIGEWVLEAACTQFQVWRQQGIAPEKLAVNISSRQFMRDNFIDVIGRTIDKTKILPQELELEITESLLLNESINTKSMFDKLAEMGVQLAIDDFGTGYSSLSYLKRFSVHTLKIDRAFTRDIPADEQATTLTLSIIAMAHALNMDVVAEGVETREQLVLLREHQCDCVQGFFFSKPLPVPEVTRYLAEQDNESTSNA